MQPPTNQTLRLMFSVEFHGWSEKPIKSNKATLLNFWGGQYGASHGRK